MKPCYLFACVLTYCTIAYQNFMASVTNSASFPNDIPGGALNRDVFGAQPSNESPSTVSAPKRARRPHQLTPTQKPPTPKQFLRSPFSGANFNPDRVRRRRPSPPPPPPPTSNLPRRRMDNNNGRCELST